MGVDAELMSDTYVLDILNDVLDALTTAYDDAGRGFDRALPFSGPPSWDCEMIAVWPSGFRHAGTGTMQHPNPTMPVVRVAFDVKVLVLRCVQAVSNEGIPSEDVIRSDGEAYAKDMWIAVRTMTRAMARGTLFGSCESTRFQRTQEQMASGGLSAFTLTIEVTV